MADHRKVSRREGQDHPKASLTDSEVELLRQMHEEFPAGHAQHLGYRALSKIFEIPRGTVRGMCKYRCRK